MKQLNEFLANARKAVKKNPTWPLDPVSIKGQPVPSELTLTVDDVELTIKLGAGLNYATVSTILDGVKLTDFLAASDPKLSEGIEDIIPPQPPLEEQLPVSIKKLVSMCHSYAYDWGEER